MNNNACLRRYSKFQYRKPIMFARNKDSEYAAIWKNAPGWASMSRTATQRPNTGMRSRANSTSTYVQNTAANNWLMSSMEDSTGNPVAARTTLINTGYAGKNATLVPLLYCSCVHVRFSGYAGMLLW